MSAMKKKILVSVVLLLLTALTFSYGTYAYFTDHAEVGVMIRVGSVRLRVLDVTFTENGAELPGESPIAVLPGTRVEKTVKIKNDGELPVFIRVKPSAVVTLGAENVGREEEIDLSLISLDVNDALWVERDGYYYYHRALLGGEWSEDVYETVSFSHLMDALYMNSTVFLTLDVYAVQANGNGSDPLSAVGWPDDGTGGAL